MKKRLLITLILFLVACGGETAVSTEPSLANISLDGGDVALETQLAIGTLLLEDGETAVSTQQAETLLPLWQAYQNLNNSGTAADAELQAVLKQIDGLMSAEQRQAIADFDISEDSLQTLLESGAIQLAGFGAPEGEDGTAAAGGFARGGGGFAGGGPGGGGPGGELPGGGGGPGGGAFGDVAPAEGDADAEAGQRGGGAQSGFATRAVITLLETKTGVVRTPTFNTFQLMAPLAEALGVDAQTLRNDASADTTISELVEANGGDVDAIRATLLEYLDGVELAEGQTAEQVVDEFLSGGLGGRPNQGG